MKRTQWQQKETTRVLALKIGTAQKTFVKIMVLSDCLKSKIQER